jgi:hypothetical protein
LPLLAAGATPLLKVKSISQTIDSSNLSIVNSTTLSSPFATFSFSASATFEVRTPSRIQVLLKTFETMWLLMLKKMEQKIEKYSNRVSS